MTLVRSARFWSRLVAFVGAGWLVVLVSSCYVPEPVRTPAEAPVPVDSSTIYVIRHGWHAGIAVRSDHLTPGGLPAFPAVPDARYLEIGWGERHYYPHPDPGIWTLLRAGLWPTRSVVHVVPVQQAIPERFPRQSIVRLRVDTDDLQRLTAFVRASLTVATNDKAVPVAPGYYQGSRFFASPLRYHVFQNCNHWAAEALEMAGCTTARWRTLTVGAVINQAARCGTQMQ